MPKQKLTDIAPDGVDIAIDWDKFVVGSSVFIPCINTAAAVREVREVGKLETTQVDWRVVIEGGKYGVRVWRVS